MSTPSMSTGKKHALLRYLGYAKPYKWAVALVIAAGIAKFTLPLAYAELWRIGLDGVIENKAGFDDAGRMNLLGKLVGIFFAVSIVEAVAVYLRGVMTVSVAERVVFDLRQDLWRHIQRLHLGFHQSRPTGSILSRLVSDTSVAQQMIRGGVFNICIDLGSGVFVLIVLLTISWQLTLAVLAVLPVYGLLYRKLNPRVRQASHDVQEQTSVMSGSAVERLAGIAVVQSFAQEPAEQQRFAEQAEDLRYKVVRRGHLNQSMNAMGHMLTQLSQLALLALGGYLAIHQGLTAGNTVKFLLSMHLLYLPIRRFSEINIVYQNSMAAIERIFSIFDIAPEVRERPDAQDRSVQSGQIDFQRVRFRYSHDGPDVLSDLSFTVTPGERVAIVGESGAGKSTLVTLIPRLYDIDDGVIRIDGMDVRDYRLQPLRRSIGIVLQDPILFSGPIGENLRYARRDATDEEIVAAAKAANAHQFIVALPEGYDSEIGERGTTLSGGQRQRISLARTILQNPRILILDEATSSLDSESENLITEALQRVMAGRTCVIIAHRLSTVVGADRILVLREGRLVEEGPHHQLLQADGYYRRLFEQQFGPLKRLMDESLVED